jgi:DNA repair exonuclease SbcCD ATPase subunit
MKAKETYMRKAISSTSLVATFVAAALSISGGVALAKTAAQEAQGQTTQQAQDQSRHSSVLGRAKSDVERPITNAKSDVEAHKSLAQLNDELKREDKEMRQANAKLEKARERLARTQRQLKQAQSREEHVATAERRATRTERQEEQTAPQTRERSNAGETSNTQSSTSGSGTPR